MRAGWRQGQAAVAIVVHYIGGPFDCQTEEYRAVPQSTLRTGGATRGTQACYVLHLFEVDGRAAWGYVSHDMPLASARALLQARVANARPRDAVESDAARAPRQRMPALP